MKDMTRRGLIFSGAAMASAAVLTPAEAASGSIALHIVSAGFIFGLAGGSGTLTFRGQQFPLSIGGISAGATFGASGTDLVGTVSHLTNVHDIEGIYSAVGAGLSVAGGRSAVNLANSNGVILRLRGRQMGFMISFDLSGMNISLR
jgi:hypothetical protein